MSTTTNAPRRRRTIQSPLVVLGLIVLLGAIAGGAYGFSYLFLREEAPAAVGASTVASEAAVASTAATQSAAAQDDGEVGDVSGVWSIDSSVGSFDDFSGSFVGYRVQEELASIGAATAVGRTPDVTGSLTLDGATLTEVQVTADLTTLQSDDDRRDGQLRTQALETNAFPTATFVLTDAIELPAAAADGDTVQVTATGELTLHGVTQTVEVPITAALSDGVITVTGSIDILFSDYEMDPPSSMIVLSVDDQGVMEFQLHFTQSD